MTMTLFHDGEKTRKMVLFYIIYTCTYFPILFALIIWSKGIHILGNYSFQTILFMIVGAETTKYLVSNIHFQRYDYNLTKKSDTSLMTAASRLICNRSRPRECTKTLFAVTLSTLLFFLVAVLFGAEIFEKREETMMFSALLSILTIFPACLNQGVSFIIPLLMGAKATNMMETLIIQNMHLTFIGAWLGAIAIPLDWDRPWQVWPIPCSFGAMTGFVVSHIVMVQRLRTNVVKKFR